METSRDVGGSGSRCIELRDEVFEGLADLQQPEDAVSSERGDRPSDLRFLIELLLPLAIDVCFHVSFAPSVQRLDVRQRWTLRLCEVNL